MKGIFDHIVAHQHLVHFGGGESRPAVYMRRRFQIFRDHLRAVEGVVDIARDGKRFAELQPVMTHRRNFAGWIETLYRV